ncbi:MAG: flagellar assembly protein FliW [Spirochaetes bacterium]|nr:flagellar assembly protein FliW [Spirochaetota bacterium]
MTIETKAYGKIPIDDRQLIDFPSGLYGFESYTRYALLDAHQKPFYWLQSLDDVQVAFVLINPYVFRPDFVLEIPDEDYEDIGKPEEDDVLVFAVVTIPTDGTEITANLQGPVVINRNRGLGRQSISLDPRWQTKHSIVEEMARRE